MATLERLAAEGVIGPASAGRRQAQRKDGEFRSYVQQAAVGSASPADQLAKLADLRDREVISAEEFEREKAKVLA